MVTASHHRHYPVDRRRRAKTTPHQAHSFGNGRQRGELHIGRQSNRLVEFGDRSRPRGTRTAALATVAATRARASARRRRCCTRAVSTVVGLYRLQCSALIPRQHRRVSVQRRCQHARTSLNERKHLSEIIGVKQNKSEMMQQTISTTNQIK